MKPKTLLAAILLLLTVAIVCTPLFIVWYGLVGDMTLGEHIAVVAVGLFLSWLIKPISVLTDNDYDFF